MAFGQVNVPGGVDETALEAKADKTALEKKADKENPAFSGTLSLGRKENSTVGVKSVAIGDDLTGGGAYSFTEGKQNINMAYNGHVEGELNIAIHKQWLLRVKSGTPSSKTINIDTTFPNYAEAIAKVTPEMTIIVLSDDNNSVKYRSFVVDSVDVTEGHIVVRNSFSYADVEYGANIAVLDNNTTIVAKSPHVEGFGCAAVGDFSHAEGHTTVAAGKCSHAAGYGSEATGAYSEASGLYCKASGGYSHAGGERNVASGSNSFAIGGANTVSGDSAFAEGRGNTVSGDYSHAEGGQNTASGNYSHAEGRENTVSGECSHAEGGSCTVTGERSHVEGSRCTIEGCNNTHAEGNGCKCINTGSCAHAEGMVCTVENVGCHAEGEYTIAKGWASHSGGGNTIAAARWQSAIGAYNVESESESDRLIIGKGSGDTARANCFRVTDTGVYATGAHNTTGADYAELFEWADGNPDKEDRVGRFVTLDGEKIRLAGPGDAYLLGIISGNPSVVGDVHDDQWQGMYLYDIFGRPVWEDVDVPDEIIGEPDPENPEDMTNCIIRPAHTEHRQKLNPDYDGTQKYIPRSQRPEWAAVGMMGKLVMVDDGTCQINGWCAPGADGIATASEAQTKFRVMARLDETHIRVLALPQ